MKAPPSTKIRLEPNSPNKWYHRFQHWYAPFAYASYSLFWIFVKDFRLLYGKGNHLPTRDLVYHFNFWIQKVTYSVYLIVLPLFFVQVSWQVVLFGILAMHLSQSWFVLFTFLITHHVDTTAYPATDKNGKIQSSWLRNQIESSNDFHPFSFYANFLFGGFNNHIAHHLFPHLPHPYYPAISRAIYPIIEANRIRANHNTYWGGIAAHFRHLKNLGIAS